MTPRLSSLSCGLATRAHVMGYWPASEGEPSVIDAPYLRTIARCAAEAGIGAVPAATLQAGADDEERLADALSGLIEAIDASPRPQAEWAPVRELLGDELVARLVGAISISSLRRYASGERETPDEVAWRLHVVARVLSSLMGSYNDYGLRRWFGRPRAQLGGRTPADVLAEAGHEDDAAVRQTIELADALVGAGAAT